MRREYVVKHEIDPRPWRERASFSSSVNGSAMRWRVPAAQVVLGVPALLGGAEPPGDSLTAEVGRRAVEDQQAVGERDEAIREV